MSAPRSQLCGADIPVCPKPRQTGMSAPRSQLCGADIPVCPKPRQTGMSAPRSTHITECGSARLGMQLLLDRLPRVLDDRPGGRLDQTPGHDLEESCPLDDAGRVPNLRAIV